MRKTTACIVICAILATVLVACTSPNKPENESSLKTQDTMPKTNIDNISIDLYEGIEDAESYITYGDSTKEIIGKDYIELFINGSIIKNANLILDNDSILLPVSVVTENLGAQLDWNAETGKATIVDGENTIEFFIDNNNAKVNGKELNLDVAPKLLYNNAYVPISFAHAALNAKVEYFDGEDTTNPHIVERMPRVMVSRYPSNVKKLSEEEAIQKTREQLIIAYEKKFGKFIPLAENEAPSREDDKAILRDVMSTTGR